MGRKLIGIDLDSTTLNNAGQVSMRTQATLQAVQAAGHIVSIITGRPARLSVDIYDKIGLKSPMINFNGAIGYKPHQKWQYEYSHEISHDIVFDIMEYAPQLEIGMVVAENRHGVWAQGIGPAKDSEEAFFFPPEDASTKPLSHLDLATPVNAILLHGYEGTDMAKVQRFLEERYGTDKIVAKSWGAKSPVIEVAHAGVTKTTGLDYLRHVYQIEADDIYAFGDEMNDYDMIDYATHGVVMKNGNSKLKSISNDITAYDNEEDGLARYLETLLKLSI